VDEAALAAQVDFQLRGGVHGLLVLGTIGEGEYASMAEREQVIRVAVAAAKGCVPVVVGIHTCDLAVALDQTRQAAALGASAVLVKYIGRPCADACEVYAFYEQLTAAGGLPVFYYHYPSQTGLQLSPRAVARILLLPGVVGIKESTLDLSETQDHFALAGAHGKVFLSGTALNLTQFLGVGGHGAMCPEAAVLPNLTVQSYQDYMNGQKDLARERQKGLFVVAPVLRGGPVTERAARLMTMTAMDQKLALPMGSEQPQARLKATLGELGLPLTPEVRPPLPGLSRLDEWKVRQAVRKIQERGLDGVIPPPPGLVLPQGPPTPEVSRR
jgi:4-hydroxy-tetrahydrodipicolinate synthase